MSKDFLVKKVKEQVGCTSAVADAAVEAVLQGVMDGAASGGLSIIGFGSFKVVDKPAREGRNPQTGQPMQIPARKAVKFTPGKKFKEAVS